MSAASGSLGLWCSASPMVGLDCMSRKQASRSKTIILFGNHGFNAQQNLSVRMYQPPEFPSPDGPMDRVTGVLSPILVPIAGLARD
jgi:hypothetical protein